MKLPTWWGDDKKKEEEKKKRLQHPHMIESRKHWDWEQAYYDCYPKKDKEEDK